MVKSVVILKKEMQELENSPKAIDAALKGVQ